MREYTFFSLISNKNKYVQDKVNFFADYFHITVQNLGFPGFKSLENHRSLIEKIKFHVDNPSIGSKKAIERYFENKLLSNKDPIVKELFDNDIRQLRKIKNKYIKGNNSIQNEFNHSLSSLSSKIANNLFEHSLNKIINVFECPKPLNKHSHVKIIQYYTEVIICEFIFVGFPKEYLYNLFDKILDNSVLFKNNSVHTEAPLPPILLEIKDDPEKTPADFYKSVNDYLKNRNLRQQFLGIYYLFKTSMTEKILIFKLDNIRVYDLLELDYKEIFLTNKVENLYIVNGKTSDKFMEFFGTEGTVYAKVKLVENNDIVAKLKAILKIKSIINFINYNFNCKARLNTDDYIITDKNKSHRKKDFTRTFYNFDIEDLKNKNLFSYFKENGNPVIHQITNLEEVYMEACASDNKDVKIIDFWRYLEACFSHLPAKGRSDIIIKRVSKILSINKIYDIELRYFDLASKILHSAHLRANNSDEGTNKYLSISNKELLNLLESINFNRLSEVINHPYITNQLNWYINSSNEEKSELFYHWYFNVLIQTYEQRNYIQHSCIYNEMAADNVLLTLPFIVMNFRNLLINSLLHKEYQSFEDVIKDLESKKCYSDVPS